MLRNPGNPRPESRTEREYPSNDGRFAPWDREVPYQTNISPWAESLGWNDDVGDAEDGANSKSVHWENHVERRRPSNEYEALMECAPYQEPETHAEQLLALREVLADAIDSLPEREREVFDGVFLRRETLSRLGERLGYSKMHVSRIRDKATSLLRERLADNPLILEYLDRHQMIEVDDD